MQALEALVSIEVTISSGRRPDVQAHFQDGSVTIEAISPVFNADVGETAKNYQPLIELIETRVPEGWSVAVRKLPRLGPNDSRKRFKRAVEELLNLPSVQEDTQPLDLTRELPQGTIHLQAVPRRLEGHAVMIEPALGFVDDSTARIEYALDRKRSQVRGADTPVLLAIDASGLASELLDAHMYEPDTGIQVRASKIAGFRSSLGFVEV
jgi:hypothetical protein